MFRNTLALNGGAPIRNHFLPYSRQQIAPEDIAAVETCLKSDWLTTGPFLNAFETQLATISERRYCAGVSNGTAALHAAYHAAGISDRDEVIVPAITFAATANAALYLNAIPVFADIAPDTILITPDTVAPLITPATKAIVAVDFAGQPCNYEALSGIAAEHNLILIADCCHSLGATYNGRPTGALADLAVYSFHPVKPITTGEGGAVVTDNADYYERICRFRNHGITTDHHQRQKENKWHYEMVELGFNYRLSDIQAAVGLSQSNRLQSMLARRTEIAHQYDQAFSGYAQLSPLRTRPRIDHSYHLYVIRLQVDHLSEGRDTVFQALRAEGIGVNVHYLPVYRHPYYQQLFKSFTPNCPVADKIYQEILSLPIYSAMTDNDVQDVIQAMYKVLEAFQV